MKFSKITGGVGIATGATDWCTSEPEDSPEAAAMAIALNPANAVSASAQVNGDFSTRQQALTGVVGRFWRPGSILRVSFVNATKSQRDRIMRIARLWCDHANIRFRVVADTSTPAPDIRVHLGNRRNWSMVGTDSRLATEAGTHSMSFMGTSPSQSTILHEFGHALGLKHEHQNPTAGIKWNKPAVYQHAQTNWGWTKARVDGNIFDKLDASTLNYSRFDPDSIMGYNILAGWTTDGFTARQGTTLSAMDISYVGDWYPFGGAHRASRSPENGNYKLYARDLGGEVKEKTWSGGRWRPSTTTWQPSQPGRITGHPGVADVIRGGEVNMIARAERDGAPTVSSFRNGRWDGWDRIGGGITGSPALVDTGDAVWAFVRGVSGRPFYKRRKTDWDRSASGWTNLGGAITGSISADAEDERIAIAARGRSGQCAIKMWSGRAWRPGATQWVGLELQITGQPDVALMGPHLHVLARGPNAQPFHLIYDWKRGRIKQPWTPLGGWIAGGPTLVRGFDGRLHALVRGSSRRVFHRAFDGQHWSPGNWHSLGGQGVDTPTAVALPPSSGKAPQLHVFVTGTSGAGFRKIWDGKTWSARWQRLGGQFV